LERFLRCVSRHDFLVNSVEFRTFARPGGVNIDKALESMPKMTPKQTYDRMREAIGINEADFDTSTRDVFATRISDFNFFLKKVKPFLRQMKLDLAI
jgi:hypothetical protein